MLFVVLFVGVLLLTATLWLPPRVRLAPPPKSLYLPLGLALLAALCTAPSGGYWAVGGQLGVGVAIGALAAGLGAWLSASDDVPWRTRLVSAAPIFLALPVLLLFFRSSLFDALGGLALGWLGVSVLIGANSLTGAPSGSPSLGGAAAFKPAARAFVPQARERSFLLGALVAGVGIAGYRAAPAGESAALLLIGAGGLLFSLLTRFWPGWRGLVAFALLFGLELRWLTTKVLPDSGGKLFYAALLGAALGLVLLWLKKDKRPAPALGLLLVLAGHVIGSHLGGAYGAALLSVALLAVAGFVGEGADPAPLALAALLVVYRWLPLRWPELKMGFTDSHAFTGLLVGALVCQLVPPARESAPRSPVIGEMWWRFGAIGLAAAALVGTLVLLGPKAALPLGVGLALGVAVTFPSSPGPFSQASPLVEGETERMLPPPDSEAWEGGRGEGKLLLALGALFALIQFAGHILPAVEMGRTARLEILVGLAVVSLILWRISSPKPGGQGAFSAQGAE